MERRMILLGGGVFAGIAIWTLYAFNPNIPGTFPECPVNWLTGIHCPGCGTLRSLHFLLHGNVSEALSYNALMILSIPVLIWMLFRPRWIQSPSAPWAVLGIIVIYTVARNTLFPMLAPGVT